MERRKKVYSKNELVPLNELTKADAPLSFSFFPPTKSDVVKSAIVNSLLPITKGKEVFAIELAMAGLFVVEVVEAEAAAMIAVAEVLLGI